MKLVTRVTDYLADHKRTEAVEYLRALVEQGFFRTTDEDEQEEILREVLESACEPGRRKALVALGLEKEPQWVRKQIKVQDMSDDKVYAYATIPNVRKFENGSGLLATIYSRDVKDFWSSGAILDVFVRE